MQQLNDVLWDAELDPFPLGTEVFYYIHAKANSGKEINRPLAAPDGYWAFDVNCLGFSSTNQRTFETTQLGAIFPNPTDASISIPVRTSVPTNIDLRVTDLVGRTVTSIFSGKLLEGAHQLEYDLNDLGAGTYFLILQWEGGMQVEKLIRID